MTGEHLVLCDGPASDPRAFRGAYARYLASCRREFVSLESADERDMEMFRRWTTNRTLDHFIVQ